MRLNNEQPEDSTLTSDDGSDEEDDEDSASDRDESKGPNDQDDEGHKDEDDSEDDSDDDCAPICWPSGRLLCAFLTRPISHSRQRLRRVG